ncbi:molecular chaperone GrpE [Kibdelosporangium banguiense]|uniref:Protein GrpE n=1 Tax=Kibdelosporangium banguiense TaxID=1365924 RepID=A0ABS4TC47_9PSEU|nr:nucleotide exchange factor GrpE [Kibdelosporangium banguiense]MBP2322008.1 molecular chaperone GrpE [Kibdelosporangium banguiense]
MTDQVPHDNSNSAEDPRVVVRDRRRIDPDTGQVRTVTEEVPVDAAGAPEGGKHAASDEVPVEGEVVSEEPSPEASLQTQLDERTADLQRLQAEYANYRKRVDRDRETVVSSAKASVAGELLAVLDDVERAAAHGDLTGAFKAVADKLTATLQRVGLEAFGHENEAFDPAVHEAVQHSTSPDVQGPTVTAVLRRGYRFGERTLRPALVAVTDHEPGAEQKPVEGEWLEPSEGNAGGESADRN